MRWKAFDLIHFKIIIPVPRRRMLPHTHTHEPKLCGECVCASEYGHLFAGTRDILADTRENTFHHCFPAPNAVTKYSVRQPIQQTFAYNQTNKQKCTVAPYPPTTNNQEKKFLRRVLMVCLRLGQTRKGWNKTHSKLCETNIRTMHSKSPSSNTT